MDTTKLLVIGVAVVVVAAAAGVVIYNNNNNKSSSELVDLDGWDEIVNDASGQTVNLGFYITMDPAINQSFWPYMQKEMKEKYNITVTCDNTGYTGYGPVAANESVAEIQASKMSDGKYDLIWGNTSAYSAMTVGGTHYDYVYSKTNADGKQWAQIIPNKYYLKDGSENTIASQFSGYVSGTALNFSNGQTMLVYNQDFNRLNVTLGNDTVKVPYNCVLVFGNNGSIASIVKVASDSEGSSGFAAGNVATLSAQTKAAFESAWSSCSTAYKISDVRSVLAHDGAKGVIAYGLPSTFTDLAAWVKIYSGQFTYPNYTNASASFHTDLIVQAAIYELTWNGNDGWKAAPDRAANVTAVNDALKNVTNEEQFKNAFGYVFNYLNDIEPYLYKYTSDSDPYITTGTVTPYNGKVVGNGTEDKDYEDGTIMLALTTCTSIDSRVIPGSGHGVVAQYSYNAGAYSLSTGCYSDYYVFIPANSSHVSAAMVVANWLLDPEVQFRWYTQTGNGLNIDLDKEMYGSDGKGLGYTVSEYYENADHQLSTYTLTLSVDTLKSVTVASDFTPYATISANAWKTYVYNSNVQVSKA